MFFLVPAVPGVLDKRAVKWVVVVVAVAIVVDVCFGCKCVSVNFSFLLV